MIGWISGSNLYRLHSREIDVIIGEMSSDSDHVTGEDPIVGSGYAGSHPAAGNGLITARGSTDTIVWALRSEPGEVRPHNEDFAIASIPCDIQCDISCGIQCDRRDNSPCWSCDPGTYRVMDEERCRTECGCLQSNMDYYKYEHTEYQQPDQVEPDLDTKPPLFIVADGLGGHDGGEVASRIAAHTVINAWYKGSSPSPQAMRSSVRKANAAVFGAAYEYDHQGMATTVTALAIDGDEAIIAHVGDSRAYMVRHSRAEQLTNDHSQVAEMLRRGLLTPEQAANHPARSVLTRCVGLAPSVSVDLMRRPFSRGDIFVLCTDGLWDMLARQEIADISGSLDRESSPADVEEVVDRMVNTALERGATDNVTAVVVLAIDSSPAINPPNSRGMFKRWIHR